jgi:hypothetical protein
MGGWEYGRFRWKLWKLQRRERRAEEQYRRLIARAQKRGDQQKLRDLKSEESHMSEIAIGFQVAIRKLHSEYLIRKAARLIVPLPELGDENGVWDRDKGQLFLSDPGINKVRVALRAERKARVELFLMWVPAVLASLGR